MKTIVLSIAFIAASSLVAFSANVQQDENSQTTVENVVTQEEDVYTDIELADLNENVQAAINSLSETFTVKSITYNAEKKLTKVSLISKEDEKESVVILDDEGKAVQ